MSITDPEAFEMACRCFGFFTANEKERTLEVFSRLRYPSVAQRFFEAVYREIESQRRSDAAKVMKP